MPYRERIQPGDLSPGDLLPVEEDDPRLVPTYSFGDDPLDTDDKAQIRAVAQDLGLGRVRTLSPIGRDLAAQRWYDGDGGPNSPIAQAAPLSCDHLRLPGPAQRVRSGSCSACAPTATPTTTAASSPSTTGAGRTPRCSSPRSTSPCPCPDPVFDTLSPGEIETF